MRTRHQRLKPALLACTLLLAAQVGGAQERDLDTFRTASAPAQVPRTQPFIPADHVTTAPVSERANIVLASLIRECPIVNGEWDRHQGDPGCVELFSSLFGYRAGLRRGREDLVAIGRAAAENESGRLAGAAADLLFAGKGLDMTELAGMPALLVSGTAGGNHRHYTLFITTLQTFLASIDDRSLNAVQRVGTAYVLAEVYRFDPRRKAVWIERARELAAGLHGGRWVGCFGAFAWSAIARASGEPADLERAKDITLSVSPQFSTARGVIRFDGPYPDVLSLHLTLTEAMADLAMMEPGGPWYGMGTELVEYVFSDAYFNGKFLVHDIAEGRQATTFCTGCNYHALYAADRIYGDTLKLDPVPPLRVVQAPLRIIKAEYGAGDKWLDVTQSLAGQIRRDRLKVQVSNDIGGDPAEGRRKELRVEYDFQGTRHTKSAPEGEWLKLP